MSALINQSIFLESDYTHRKTYFDRSQHQNQDYLIKSQCNKFLRQFKSYDLKNYQIQNIQQIGSFQLEAVFYNYLRQKFGIISKISINFKTKCITIRFSFIQSDSLVLINKKSQINMVNQILEKINLFNSSQNLNFIINSSNGLLQGLTYINLFSNNQVTQILKKYIIFFMQSTQKLMMDQVHYIMQKLDYTFKKQKVEENTELSNMWMKQCNMMTQIRDHLGLSHINLHIACINEEQKHNKAQSVSQFMNNRSNILKTSKLSTFVDRQSYLYSLRLDEFYYNQSKLTTSIVQNQLSRAYQPMLNKFDASQILQGQNAYIYNSVMIKDEKNVSTIKSHYKGGFSRFQLAQIQMANSDQVDPVFLTNQMGNNRSKTSQPQSNIKKLIYLRKMVAIKMPNDNKNYQKIKHEKIIVQNLKNVVCPYFIKYYNATQSNFAYKHYLLMDYMGDLPNLSTYYKQHQETMTIPSMLKIFLHLARSLTILEQKSIAHMDFTPHNIFITDDVMPKIVDFGQSYHPSLQKDGIKNYLPGYTLPYCPPQTFNRKKVFQPRSDVFSLGIIMFKILFNRFPYNITKQLQKSYINGTYMQKFFLSPQNLQDMYNNRITTLTLQLIMHCMQQNSNNRPYSFWIYVSLIKILQLLN